MCAKINNNDYCTSFLWLNSSKIFVLLKKYESHFSFSTVSVSVSTLKLIKITFAKAAYRNETIQSHSRH